MFIRILPIQLEYWNSVIVSIKKQLFYSTDTIGVLKRHQSIVKWFKSRFYRYNWSIETLLFAESQSQNYLFYRYNWSIETPAILLNVFESNFFIFYRYNWSIETTSHKIANLILAFILPIQLEYWNYLEAFTQGIQPTILPIQLEYWIY